MGGVPSIVQNNDELVEYLLHNCYVNKKKVELVFRAVDRADYVLSSHQESAYNDLAWKHGNLHLSAPCVYGVAMEFLSLKAGQSFLNIGSGTGYFSTMAGLLLGPYGINHGIELHEDCIQYARDRLENFKRTSRALEEFEFCEPSFVQGNCLRVVPARRYDTVYCGAAVSEANIDAVKRFVRIGGSIVMPYKGRLCFFRRLNETGWTCKKSLGVSFATLVTPDTTDQNVIALPESEPLSLQELCRTMVRQILRKNVWLEHPELEKRNLSLPDQQSHTGPFLDQFDDGASDEDDDDDDDEEEEEDDGEEDDDDDEDDTDGHIIQRTRFLFNMEVDQLQLRRVAMLVRQGTVAEQLRDEEFLDRMNEESRNNDPPTVAGSTNSPEQDGSSGTAVSQSMDVSPSLAVDLSLNEQQVPQEPQVPQVPQHWSTGRVARNRSKTTNERNTQPDPESDSDRESGCDSDKGHVTQWKKIAKRENTDSGIVDDVNLSYDDTSSSLNVDHSDSDADDDMDVDLSSVALRETFRRVCGSRSKDFTPSQLSSENQPTPDYVESCLFVTYMKEKIQLLPLPTKLKLYMNHNRNL